MNKIGKAIDKIRNSFDLTIEEMSFIIGISQRNLQKIINGDQKPSFDTLVKISNNFDISLDEVVSSSEDSPVCIFSHLDKLCEEGDYMHLEEVYSHFKDILEHNRYIDSSNLNYRLGLYESSILCQNNNEPDKALYFSKDKLKMYSDINLSDIGNSKIVRPTDVRYIFLYSQFLQKIKKPDESLNLLQSLTKHKLKNNELELKLFFILGKIYFFNSQFDNASLYLDKCLATSIFTNNNYYTYSSFFFKTCIEYELKKDTYLWSIEHFIFLTELYKLKSLKDLYYSYFLEWYDIDLANYKSKLLIKPN